MDKPFFSITPEKKAQRDKLDAEIRQLYATGGIDKVCKVLVDRQVKNAFIADFNKWPLHQAEAKLKEAQDELDKRDEGAKTVNANKRLERVKAGEEQRTHRDGQTGITYDEGVMQSIDDKAKDIVRDWKTDEIITDGRQPIRDFDIAIFDGMDTLYFGELVIEYTEKSKKPNEQQREKEGYQRALAKAAEVMVLTDEALRKRYPQKKWRCIYDDARENMFGRDPYTGEIIK